MKRNKCRFRNECRTNYSCVCSEDVNVFWEKDLHRVGHKVENKIKACSLWKNAS